MKLLCGESSDLEWTVENASVREMEFDILSVEPTNVAFIHRFW